MVVVQWGRALQVPPRYRDTTDVLDHMAVCRCGRGTAAVVSGYGKGSVQTVYAGLLTAVSSVGLTL